MEETKKETAMNLRQALSRQDLYVAGKIDNLVHEAKILPVNIMSVSELR